MSKRRVLGLDYETYSETDLLSCGSYKYMEDPHFEVLLLSYAFDFDAPTCVDFTAGETIPGEVRAALDDPNIIKTAYNCAFEREATRRTFGIYCPPEQWEDTMILAAYCGLPLGLGRVGEAMNLPSDEAKDKRGRDLIRQFCNPRKPTKSNPATRIYPKDAPEDWETFKEYNRQDVVAERAIRLALLKWKPDEAEHAFWCLDARINETGIRFDRTLAENAVAFDERYKADLTAQAIALSGLQNPRSVSQIKTWLKEQEGVDVPSLNKKVIADVVAQLSSEKTKDFMDLRRELSKSSTAKYTAMLRAGGRDDHIRGAFQFYGGHTGRFAGRLVQLQNLSKNYLPDIAAARYLVRANDYETTEALYGSVSSVLSELVRTALIPEPGCRFVVADFSAIEARVTAWFAGEEWRLQTFRDGGDIYCASASQMFHVPVEKHGINGDLRPKGKIAELALGYGGGTAALKAFGADKMGMSETDMVETVDKWREASPHICALWRSLEHAAARAVVRQTQAVSTIGGVLFSYEDGVLWMTLPSGRRMAYWDAKYEESRSRFRQGRTLSYMYIDQNTKKWLRIETWGGRLVENLVQATARDCLRETMMALDAAGFDIRAHVHDEVIINEPVDGRTHEDVCAIMAREIPWAPGLPLCGDGYETPFYMKD
jgi:DNA polymerase